MEDCVFCKIVAGEIPAKTVYEDETVIAFHDIHPEMPVHILLIPRQHIASIARAEDDDATLLGHLFTVSRRIAKDLSLPGYKLNVNVESAGGQDVMHVHMHLKSDAV